MISRKIGSTPMLDLATQPVPLERIGSQSHRLPVGDQPAETYIYPPAQHPYIRCVNPYLAELLRKLWLDKRFVRGEGCELIDDKGRRYLDCVAAYGALPFGF